MLPRWRREGRPPETQDRTLPARSRVAGCPYMSDRPKDLPNFDEPPISEVALGVQFNQLPGMTVPAFSHVWEAFKDSNPVVEEQPEIPPSFETFVEGGMPPTIALPPPVRFFTTPPFPRIWLSDQVRSSLIQFQRDRFIHNWRKMPGEAHYPRFEVMLERFQAGFSRFQEAAAKGGFGPIVLNQCDITYINQISLLGESRPFELFRQVFPGFVNSVGGVSSGTAEDARFALRFALQDGDLTPVARLYVTAEPAWLADGSIIIQFSLAVRGAPKSADMQGARQFFTLGRAAIVRSFAELTDPGMHKIWRRVS